MSFEEFITGIEDNIKKRFSIENSDSGLAIAPEELSLKQVFRLKYKNIDYKGVKTILLVSIKEAIDLTYPLKWAATVKETLLDPESSDLYLFIHQNGDLPLEYCLRIESSEQFCRKFMMRPEENIDHFLNRTFVAELLSESSEAISNDPLLNAFATINKEHNWINAEEQKRWQDLLMSDLSGNELIEHLFTLKMDDYEIPE